MHWWWQSNQDIWNHAAYTQFCFSFPFTIKERCKSLRDAQNKGKRETELLLPSRVGESTSILCTVHEAFKVVFVQWAETIWLLVWQDQGSGKEEMPFCRFVLHLSPLFPWDSCQAVLTAEADLLPHADDCQWKHLSVVSCVPKVVTSWWIFIVIPGVPQLYWGVLLLRCTGQHEEGGGKLLWFWK